MYEEYIINWAILGVEDELDEKDFWHSDEIIGENYGISSKKHHEKRARLLKEKGVKLIYVWSSDWEKNKEEMLKLLRKKNGII